MGNIFLEIPSVFGAEVFETLAESQTMRIERILSKGHKSPASGWYDQDENEWVMVCQGEAVVEFENKLSVTLREGDFIHILAHEKHKVKWTDPQVVTVWLAVYY